MIRLFAGSDMWRIFRPKDDEAHIGDSKNIEGMLENKFFNFRIENDGTVDDLRRLISNYFRLR